MNKLPLVIGSVASWITIFTLIFLLYGWYNTVNTQIDNLTARVNETASVPAERDRAIKKIETRANELTELIDAESLEIR